MFSQVSHSVKTNISQQTTNEKLQALKIFLMQNEAKKKDSPLSNTSHLNDR
jgi:hypothetical protein